MIRTKHPENPLTVAFVLRVFFFFFRLSFYFRNGCIYTYRIDVFILVLGRGVAFELLPRRRDTVHEFPIGFAGTGTEGRCQIEERCLASSSRNMKAYAGPFHYAEQRAASLKPRGSDCSYMPNVGPLDSESLLSVLDVISRKKEVSRISCAAPSMVLPRFGCRRN